MRNLLLFLFLIVQTSAGPLAEEHALFTFPSGSIEDLPAAPFDENQNLTSDWGVESNWENNVGLPAASNDPLVDNTESHMLADERADCIQSTDFPIPSRLRMRDQKKPFCIPPQEYRAPTSTSPALPPPDDKKPGLWPDLKQNTEMTKLWVLLNTFPASDGEKDEEVCQRAKESQFGVARHVPVCFPHPYTLDSPSDVVQPCRLCK